MGLAQSISRFFTRVFGKEPMRFFMVELYAAGKTSILSQLKLGEMGQQIPTIGFNIETVSHRNLSFTIWDIGGGDKVRTVWHHYYVGSKGGIFVIDSQDRDMIELAAQELHRLATETAEYDFPFLIFANKQDCEGAMSLKEITKALHPQDLKQKNWYIQPCSAKTGEGLHEGLEWLGNIIYPKKGK